MKIPLFFFRHAAHVSLLSFVICLWLFSGINSYKGQSEGEFDTASNQNREILSVKSFSLEGLAASLEVSEQSPKIALPSWSPSPVLNSGADPVSSNTNTQTSNVSFSFENAASDKNSELVVEVNNFRSQNGKGGLTKNSIICDFGEERLGELQTNYSHDGFSEMQQRVGKKSGAENIARTSKNMGGHYVVYEMWAKSDGHRENMLGDYTEGCGYYDGKYAVLVLAR